MNRFRGRHSPTKNPTNDLPPTLISPVVEHIMQELVTTHHKSKRSRALAVSSSAVALSIVSSSWDPLDAGPGELESSKESGWRTAYGTARMAVEIANASSDMFLPLKAVVGALSVLIKNYDVSAPQTNTRRILTVSRSKLLLTKTKSGISREGFSPWVRCSHL